MPVTTLERHAQLVAAFAHDPRVFVLRDRRSGARALKAVRIFAVGGLEVDLALRGTVEHKLRDLVSVSEPAVPRWRPRRGKRELTGTTRQLS